MRIKKVKIGIKDIKSSLDDFIDTAEAVKKGEKVKKESGVYFTSFEAFRKALTPKRLELIHAIKSEKPLSIHQLARFLNRNIKNVSEDVKYLSQLGLIEKKETEKEVSPYIKYDKILFEISV